MGDSRRMVQQMTPTKEQVWTALSLPANVSPMPDVGLGDVLELMPMAEFLDCVNTNVLIDYDGHGYWATESHVLDEWDTRVCPSTISSGETKRPQWATHVLWFNR